LSFQRGTDMALSEQAGTEQYDAFISYNHEDTEFARVLENTLEAC